MGGGTTHCLKVVTRILSEGGFKQMLTSPFGLVQHVPRYLASLALTSIDHGHVGVVGGVQPGAPLSRPAPVVGDAGPAAGHHVQPQGALRVPADADWSPLRVSAEVQTLLQIPVVVPHRPQLDCREARSNLRWIIHIQFIPL